MNSHLGKFTQDLVLARYIFLFPWPEEVLYWSQKSDLCWDIDRKSTPHQATTAELKGSAMSDSFNTHNGQKL